MQAAATAAERSEAEWQKKLNISDDRILGLRDEMADKEKAAAERERELQEQLDEAQAQQHRLNGRIEDEAVRHRRETAQMKQRFEQEMGELSQTLGRQIGSLNEQLKSEKTALQAQMLKLNTQNQEYRSMLLQSAEELRQLLSRLPVPDEADSGNIDEEEEA